MLLFVYGPYMNPRYLQEKGIQVRSSARAFLPDYDICFSTKTGDWKVAMIDIKEVQGRKVEGVLHDVTEEAAQILDDLEKLAEGKHKRIKVRLEMEDGSTTEGYTFISTKREGEFKPSKQYIEVILEGARLHGLSQTHLDYLQDFAR